MSLKLLCAGENDSSFQSVKAAFQNDDVIIIRATSIALALFLARKNQPNLIISEKNLIDGSGEELFKEIENEPDLDKTPFAFLLKDGSEKIEILNSYQNKDELRKINFLFLYEESTASHEDFYWKNKILNIIN